MTAERKEEIEILFSIVNFKKAVENNNKKEIDKCIKRFEDIGKKDEVICLFSYSMHKEAMYLESLGVNVFIRERVI